MTVSDGGWRGSYCDSLVLRSKVTESVKNEHESASAQLGWESSPKTTIYIHHLVITVSKLANCMLAKITANHRTGNDATSTDVFHFFILSL